MNETRKTKDSSAEAVPSKTLSDLAMLRKAHGANSAMGHGASNLLEALPAVPTYEPAAWATYPIQTLAWRIKWQAERLAALKAPAH